MKLSLLNGTVFCLLISPSMFAQNEGDFRSNFPGATPGLWTSVNVWERYTSGAWVPAAQFPTSADGKITISLGNTIHLTGTGSNISIDEVIIESTGTLEIFDIAPTSLVTLADNTLADLVVNGNLFISQGATLTGPGSIQVNPTGLFSLSGTGILGVSTNVFGVMDLGTPTVGAGTIQATNVQNSGTVNWLNGNLNLSTNVSFSNQGTFRITAPSSVSILTSGSNTISNTGTISNETSNIININPSFTNSSSGALSGIGTLNFSGSINNLGLISPGLSPGILSVSPNTIAPPNSTNLIIEIATDGGVAGTNFDQLNITGSAVISNIRLTLDVAGTVTDPVGTTYEIITSSGTLAGTFASHNVPTNYTITYNANNVTLTKIAMFPIPVNWGRVYGVARNNEVVLNWSTFSEMNTAVFVIEHSINGNQFAQVGNVNAAGNSQIEIAYQFIFITPDLQKTNYFRIKQVDIDGHFDYSRVVAIRFDADPVSVQAYPNPVRNTLTIQVLATRVKANIIDVSGKIWKDLGFLQYGLHQINMHSLPAGVYQIAILEDDGRTTTQKIIKQ